MLFFVICLKGLNRWWLIKYFSLVFAVRVDSVWLYRISSSVLFHHTEGRCLLALVFLLILLAPFRQASRKLTCWVILSVSLMKKYVSSCLRGLFFPLLFVCWVAHDAVTLVLFDCIPSSWGFVGDSYQFFSPFDTFDTFFKLSQWSVFGTLLTSIVWYFPKFLVVPRWRKIVFDLTYIKFLSLFRILPLLLSSFSSFLSPEIRLSRYYLIFANCSGAILLWYLIRSKSV